ncbi:hypothetical protein HMPREF9578_02593 [Cutibacterium acnes HL110PA4]|nr:hypothetical protein HMPREF9578_02593 [Cutibacterium acnes HL110PA4]
MRSEAGSKAAAGQGADPTGPDTVLGIRVIHNQWYQTSPLQ